MKKSDIHAPKASRGNWLLIAALLGLTVTYLMGFCLPHRRQMAKLEAELAQKRQAAQNVLLAEQSAQTERKIQQAEHYLLQRREQTQSGDAAALFSRISGIAQQTGVRTTRFEPSAAVPYQRIVQLPLALHFEGSFTQVFDLLGEIERLPQIVWINSLRIQPGKGAGDNLHCQANLAVFAGRTEISD